MIFTGAFERIDARSHLLAAGVVPGLYVSGANAGAGIHPVRFVHMSSLRNPKAADLQGLVECCVEWGERAENTFQNACETKCWIPRRGLPGPLLLITSREHMARALAALSGALPRRALIPYAVDDALPPGNRSRERAGRAFVSSPSADDHDVFRLFEDCLASCRFTSAGLLPAGAKTRRPSASSITVMPSGGRTRLRRATSVAGSFTVPSGSATVASYGALRALRPNSTRQRKIMLVAIPWRRQTCATLMSGVSVSCTIARFFSSLKRRRFDRPSTASGVKRYLRRVQLAALLN